MKFSKLHWLVLLACLPAFAQEEPVNREMAEKIREESYRRSQVMQTAFYLSDVIGPRLSGSAGLARANEWTRARLAAWGLQSAAIEPWGSFGQGWEIGKSYVALRAPYYQALIGTPKAWTPGTNGPVAGPVVLVAPAREEDFAQYAGKLRGKIVLLRSPWEVTTAFTPEAVRFTDAELAQLSTTAEAVPGGGVPAEAREAARTARTLRQQFARFLAGEGAALVLSNGGGKHGTHFTTKPASFATGAPRAVPEIQLAAEHYGRLLRLLEAGQAVTVEAEVQARFTGEQTGCNVIAEIPGVDRRLKSELVMLGGHLDSWHGATGATDNAAGVAVMMEAVRILQALGVKPRRTIRIALWGAEEQGALGSGHYVAQHFPPPGGLRSRSDHDKLSAYYNLDEGTGRIRGVYLQGNAAVRPIFQAWLAPFADLGAATLAFENSEDTDHVLFDEAGLPGFNFLQDRIDYYDRTHHSNMDTYERLLEDDLKQAAAVVASFVYHTAMRDEKLPRKPGPVRAEATR